MFGDFGSVEVMHSQCGGVRVVRGCGGVGVVVRGDVVGRGE